LEELQKDKGWKLQMRMHTVDLLVTPATKIKAAGAGGDRQNVRLQ
jgi:hypothetical protein